MDNHMALVNNAWATRQNYLRGVRCLMLHFNKRPEDCTVDELKAYLVHTRDVQQLSSSSVNLRVCVPEVLLPRGSPPIGFGSQHPQPEASEVFHRDPQHPGGAPPVRRLPGHAPAAGAPAHLRDRYARARSSEATHSRILTNNCAPSPSITAK